MEHIIIGEEQFQREFQGRVSSKDYFLMLKALKSHTPHFSSALCEIFNLAIDQDEKIKNRVLNLFGRKPRNADDIRNRIMSAQDILPKKN